MSTSKKTLILADPFDAKSLARLFERLTGKQVGEAEIDEMQEMLNKAREGFSTARSRAQTARAGTTESHDRLSARPRSQPSRHLRVGPTAGKKAIH